MSENVDDFLGQFERPGTKQREAKEARAKRERRTQMTVKQRKRGAVRTEQINFRCSAEFKAKADSLKTFLDCSIADLLEEALELLAEASRAKGYKGGTDA